MNPNMLMQMLRSGGNPRVILNNILQGNPMADNIMKMINTNDTKGIETLARNLAKSKGINPDEMLKQIQSQFRL